MNLRERIQQIVKSVLENGECSIWSISAATGIPKSSVHRHQQPIVPAQSVPRVFHMGNPERIPVVATLSLGSGVCIWDSVHPFAIDDSSFQSAAEVIGSQRATSSIAQGTL
jgi:hypothetical protein